jgi:DNA polymerase I-like protein with 3'-5' exonuclease and polymerase domains
MGADNLALIIGKSTPYAKELLRYHKQIYPKYWEWCDHVLNTSLLFKRISTCYDWQMHVIGNQKKDARTITNFPCQATGAEILRVASILVMENGIKIIAPVHDALLIKCDEEKAEETMLLAQKLIKR